MNTDLQYQQYVKTMDHLLGLRAEVFGVRELQLVGELAGNRLNGGTYLELGCGGGQFMLDAAKRLGMQRLLGVDRNAQLLHWARERISGSEFSNVQLHQCEIDSSDADRLVREADVVCLRNTLLYHRGYESLLLRWRDLMKEGAVFVLIEGGYKLYVEMPDDGLHTDYNKLIHEAYRYADADFNMSRMASSLLERTGFDVRGPRSAFHSTVGIDTNAFNAVVIAEADIAIRILRELFPQKWTEDESAHFIAGLNAYLHRHAADGEDPRHMYKWSEVILGVK